MKSDLFWGTVDLFNVQWPVYGHRMRGVTANTMLRIKTSVRLMHLSLKNSIICTAEFIEMFQKVIVPYVVNVSVDPAQFWIFLRRIIMILSRVYQQQNVCRR